MGLFDWFRGRERKATPFLMSVEDAFEIQMPGKAVVVGVVAQGEVRPGAYLVLRRSAAEALPVIVEALEAHCRPVKVARRGDRVERGRQNDPEYLAVNPLGRVPALVTEAHGTITEAPVVLTYIADLVPDHLRS